MKCESCYTELDEYHDSLCPVCYMELESLYWMEEIEEVEELA